MSFTSSRRRVSPGRRTRAYSYPKQSNGKNRLTKDYINPDRFIKAARRVEAEVYESTNQFSDFALSPVLQKNVAAKGITTPSPIQDKTIQHGLDGKDVVGIANTGTGKTLAFALPILERLMASPHARALIMAPTRELAQQIDAECRSIGKNSGLFGAVLIGGAPMHRQLADLRHKPQIVIGTPGRIKDHAERGSIKLSSFNIVVLDEVDRMLDMGFINDMRTILQQLATPRQSYFYSATMDHKVNTVIESFANSPITVSVKQGDTSDGVEQNIVPYNDSNEKLQKLHDILAHHETTKAIVFDDRQRDVEKLSIALAARGLRTDAIHGGKSQGQRQRALQRFKSSEIDVLVATDVAARGIDVSDISHVINYSTPKTYDDYVHRIGRAGRAGKTGTALTFIEKR